MLLQMQMPVGESEDFNGIIDVLTRKMATFSEENQGSVITWFDVPAEYQSEMEDCS